MGLSFDDGDSFKEAVESLRFNNPPSDSNAHQQMESNDGMPLQDSERNEDNITSSHPNIHPSRRVESSGSIQEIQRSGNFQVQVCCDKPPLAFASNPEFASETANGV